MQRNFLEEEEEKNMMPSADGLQKQTNARHLPCHQSIWRYLQIVFSWFFTRCNRKQQRLPQQVWFLYHCEPMMLIPRGWEQIVGIISPHDKTKSFCLRAGLHFSVGTAHRASAHETVKMCSQNIFCLTEKGMDKQRWQLEEKQQHQFTLNTVVLGSRRPVGTALKHQA